MPKDDKQGSLSVLGLVRNASKNDIRLAFFKKALYSHPDGLKNNSDREMASFSDVTEAYSNLSDVPVRDSSTPDEVFFKFFQEVLKDDNAQSLRAMLQEHDAAKCADDEYRDEDDNDIDIEREFERLLEILKNRKKKGKEVPEDMTQDKVVKCRDNLMRQREEAKKDPKKQPPKKGKQVQVPVSKPKPKSKKQLLAEQRRREKEMEKIAVELEKKKKEDEEKEKVRKQVEAEKQKRLEEERKKTEAEARRQREREQKERERLQKLEQERERKQKEEEERRKKEEMKRKKAEQERIEKDKAEKAAKIKAAQLAAKEKEEHAKNSNKNQSLKRNQPQRNDQTYPREIPPRFQRRMKQQQLQQQQQLTVFPQQPTTTISQMTPIQPQASVPSQQTLPSKVVAKPTPTVGKKKDPQRWTKGEYTGIIEDVQDDLGWSKAPPAKSSENCEDLTDDWGCEGSSWDEKPGSEERVIVDKTDQDSWPTVGGKNKDSSPDAVSEKENWGEKDTFGDSLDAVIDGMEAAEEAAGTGLLNSGKWSPENSGKDISSGSCISLTAQDFDTKGQSWSKTPGKDPKLKCKTENNSESNSSLSNSWEESEWNEGTSGLKQNTSVQQDSCGLNQNISGWNESTSDLKRSSSGWQDQPEVNEKWKAVGNPGSKPEPLPSEETGWGESTVNKRNSGSNLGASWSAQGLSLTGTEIWDDEKANGDKGSDWLKDEAQSNTDTSWDTSGQSGVEDGDWSSWSTASSKRNKTPKPNPGNDENAWLRRSLKQLVDMGFKEVEGEKALKSNNMSLEAAVSQLLGGQGTAPGNQSSLGISLPSDQNAEAAECTQTDLQGEQDVSKLNRKQRRRLMQQIMGSETQTLSSEPITDTSEQTCINRPPVSSAAAAISRLSITSDGPVEYGNDSVKNEQPTNVNSDRNITGGGVASLEGSASGTGNASTTTMTSSSVPNSVPIRPPLPAIYQQQLLQQQAQLQQLRLAQASGLMRNPLASQPVILLRQLSQLRHVQQQLASQQQLLQKQPQANALQAQQLVLQQQQIGAMMSQIQQQLIQQQQIQQHQQQVPTQFPTPAQQTLLTAQPQLQQLLLQQRKQQMNQQQQAQPPDPEANTKVSDENSASDVTQNSPRSTVAKEPTSLVQAVNSAPASPSTGKSRLGQWTQNSIQTERLSPETSGRDRNVRASPQPDTSLLITRSTNSPNSIQTTSNSVHRVLDPVSSKWGIDAAPKLSAEPPEFKPGVPWRPYQPKVPSDNVGPMSETPLMHAKTSSQEWSNSIGSQTISSSFISTNINSKPPSKSVSSSQIPNSVSHASAIWQGPVSRPAGVQRPTPLASHIRPPPGLGSENSFLNIPDVAQTGDSNWSAHSDSQVTGGSSSQFAIRAPGFQPWPSERRDAGWPGTSGQSLDGLSSVTRTSMEIGNMGVLGNSSTVGDNVSDLRAKNELSGQQPTYQALSTWLVIRNINPRVDSTALRSLCQQHGPLLTFQLNLRYGNSLIRYGNKDEAAKAHASLNGLVLAGSRLTADFATDSDIGSFFEQNSDWSTSQPITTWANGPTQKSEPNNQWPGSKPLIPPANFSSELWSFTQAGGLTSGVWSTPPSTRREGEQSTAVTENGITSPSMVTFLPPGLLNSGEST